MAGFAKYPYTDFSNMNLDWIIEKIKETLDTEAENKAYMDMLKAWMDENEPRIEHIEEMYELFEQGQLPDEVVEALENWLNEYGVLEQAKTYSDGLYNTERGQRISADNLLQTQIDELVAPTGEAPNPAEVINGRIGADNVTYASIGDAIRANDELNTKYSNYITEGDLTAFEAAGIIGSNNTWGAAADRHICIPITNAERVYIRAKTANATAYAFLTSNDCTIGTAPAFVTGTGRTVLNANLDAEVFVPAGAQYLYLHALVSGVDVLPDVIKIDRVNIKGSYGHYGNDFINDKVHNMYILGLRSTFTEYEMPTQLQASHRYGGSMNSTHLMVPVKNANNMIIKGGAVNTIIAFLRDDAAGVGQNAMYTYIPGTTTEDQNRILITAGSVEFFTIPDGCTAIYMHCSNASDPGYYLPAYFEIDGHVLMNEDEALHSVFYDDFTGDLSKWKKIIASETSMPVYYSRYYTDDDDCYIRDNMLVLRVIKDSDIPLGNAYTYGSDGQINGTTPRIYKAPYVSTEDNFSMKSGVISARIKSSNPVLDYWGFTFFTFGQNNKWPFAPEFDIMEQLSQLTTEEVTTQSGNTYPAGTLTDSVASYIHYVDGNNTNATHRTYSNIYYAGVSELERDPDFNLTDWHIYKVAWNASYVCFFVDDVMTRKVAVSNLQSGSNFLSPQDIRINVKAYTWSVGEQTELYVDWVKAESFDSMMPVSELSHSTINMRVGDEVYIGSVTIPANATNQSYIASTDDTAIIEIENYLPNYQQVLHKIAGLTAGTANVTIETNDHKIVNSFNVIVS